MASLIQPGGFGTPTQEDRRPWLWIAMIVSCGYSILTLSARLFAKWALLSVEDVIVGVAYAFGVINWGLYAQATLEGVGATGVMQDSESASELFFTSQVMMLCAIYFSKLSVLWFARRLFSGSSNTKRTHRVFDVAIGVTAMFGVTSIALFSARCNFKLALTSASQDCKSLQARWIIIQVFDAITELAIVALPTFYVSQNSIKLSSKITVIALFVLRLPCIAFMAATAVSYKPISSSMGTHFTGATTAAVWSQVLLGYSLSSASFPCVKSFLTAFLADGVYRVYDTTVGPYGSRKSRNEGSRTIGTQRSRMAASSTSDANPKAHPDEAESVASDASQRMMIERRVEIDIAVEGPSSNGAQSMASRQEFPYQGSQPYAH